MGIPKSLFGRTPSGQEVFRYTLSNSNGMAIDVINYGGIVVRLTVPDKHGVLADVVLGYDDLDSYLQSNPYFGALIGRYGNRIAHGKFNLDGITYSLPQNNGANNLHGGPNGFDKVYWQIEPLEDLNALRLSYTSVDGEEGFPGNLQVEVLYTLMADNEWRIDYRAVTDKKTVVNLTQHSYFNLTGDAYQSIDQHKLHVHADYFIPVNDQHIPLSEFASVMHTPFDFRQPTSVGSRVHAQDQQLMNGNGYDHCWVLRNETGELYLAASLYDPASGRLLEVYTTEPGIQVYSGNFLDGTSIGKGGIPYQKRHGICLETEHFPDSPNRPSFPSVVLEPGKVYSSTTVYKFSTL
ncbi:MAG: galactose mutarotase [Cyclobacteriaceae bacterium]|nr:galactose mutarotase [Cyclobacteriaceae bacterium]